MARRPKWHRIRDLQSSKMRVYQIRRGNQLVLVRTIREPDGSISLDEKDQGYADAVFVEIERACQWFHVRPIPQYSGDPRFSHVSNHEAICRVREFDWGENLREAKRNRFPVSELPIEWKRALIQNIEAIKEEWSFTWVD